MTDQAPRSGEPDLPAPEHAARRAALWATVVALPVTLIVAVVLVVVLSPRPEPSAATPEPGAATPAASAPAAQPATAVPMAAPRLSKSQARICTDLMARLPGAVRALPRRPVTAGTDQNAAYGEPPITLSCGGPAPTVAPDDFLLTMDSVCWQSTDNGATTVFTTVDRNVPVRVHLPTGYDQPAQWANEFSAAVHATVPPAKSAPSGCG